MAQLTANAYVILGLLSVRPWSAYELSKQVERSMAFYWPRAERAIYDEPKKLVAAGFATATTKSRGRRKRTVYTITAKGRHAFARWLAEESAPPRFESEAMVRVAFSPRGSKEDLLAAIRSVREHGIDLRARAAEVIGGYAEGRGPFPERQHVIALTGRFNVSYSRLLLQWADWAEAIVEKWPDTRAPEVFPGAPSVFRDLLDDLTGPPPGRRGPDR